ncbi:ABC transporter ATP-binding protein [Paenisporosarcina cavernae]|uniref:Quaternary amine transport ATP-binding protein n=1 Tax=Paenisporosarcina cavernae TaxID=2320858 RepID=A0A385YXT6_9BACL|nr:betaine/proline/choline family ABC transporter ATP-binding protein [Paenisporosarcina cavernae]AYC30418.1 ATP-binding cassette domain-containing protein [Paenisporosarcina cavernae]
MIEFTDVTKRFSDGTVAIDRLTLKLLPGKLTAIIGPSGCGKTTLMKMINRLEEPTNGKVEIDGEDVKTKSAVDLRRSIGYVIQRIGLFPHMTIEKNAGLVPSLQGWSKEKKRQRIEELMTLVGLDPAIFLNRYPLELSGGQQQRVGVVRALASDPNILLMDEPFSALDPLSREQLQMEMKDLQQRIHKTIVFVTHDMDEALRIADCIVVMRSGKIEQVGTPDEIIHSPANDFVRQFIGSERLKNQRQFSQILLRDLTEFYSQTPKETVSAMISEDASVKEAVTLLQSADTVEIKRGESTVGFLTQQDILNAMLREEEGAKA